MKLTSDRYLVPRLRISESVPQIPQCDFITRFIIHLRSHDLRQPCDYRHQSVRRNLARYQLTPRHSTAHHISLFMVTKQFHKVGNLLYILQNYLKLFDYFCENAFFFCLFSASDSSEPLPAYSQRAPRNSSPARRHCKGDTCATTCRY